MTDGRLRELERRPLDPEARARLLSERVRAGTLTRERLVLAAWCGSPDALAALGWRVMGVGSAPLRGTERFSVVSGASADHPFRLGWQEDTWLLVVDRPNEEIAWPEPVLQVPLWLGGWAAALGDREALGSSTARGEAQARAVLAIAREVAEEADASQDDEHWSPEPGRIAHVLGLCQTWLDSRDPEVLADLEALPHVPVRTGRSSGRIPTEDAWWAVAKDLVLRLARKTPARAGIGRSALAALGVEKCAERVGRRELRDVAAESLLAWCLR